MRANVSLYLGLACFDSWLFKREGIRLWSAIKRGRHVQFTVGSHRDAWPDHGQGSADHARAGAGVHGALALLGLQSRKSLVAEARTRHRHLLLVLRPRIRPCIPDRPADHRRRRHLQYSRRRRAGGVLRQWPWSVVGTSAVGAGGAVPGGVGFHALLAA